MCQEETHVAVWDCHDEARVNCGHIGFAISKRADDHASRICCKQSMNCPGVGNIHIADEVNRLTAIWCWNSP
jgi:hypothetical protein